MSDKKIKLLRIATVPFALLGSRDLLNILERNERLDLQVACSDGEFLDLIQSELTKDIFKIPIARNITPFQDLKSIFLLYRYLKTNKFDIVHSNTPKGGMVTSIASFLARVPVRLHSFTGQRWATLHGLKKKLLMTIDKVICSLNTFNYADSKSQVDLLVSEKVVNLSKIKVLGHGAFNGINLTRFNYDLLLKNKSSLRKEYGINDTDICIGFVGRVVKEKGVEELVFVINKLREKGYPIHLFLIGPLENDLDPLPQNTENMIKEKNFIHHLGRVNNPENYLICADIFCLPSYREGFPMAVLEAASLKIPSVVTNVSGCNETVEDSVTGLICNVKSTDSLFLAIEKLILDENLRKTLGNNAYDHILKYFTNQYFEHLYVNEYSKILNERVHCRL